MTYAHAMSQSMSRLALSISKMGTQMRPDPMIIEGERWKLIDQLEQNIVHLQDKILTDREKEKLRRLERLLEKKENEVLDD